MNQFEINKPEHLRSPEAWAAWQQECRERNEQARQALQERLEAERKAIADKRQAERDAEAAVLVEAFRRQARAAFPGTDAQFESAFPTLLQQWQVQQALAKQNSVIEAKRAAMRDMF